MSEKNIIDLTARLRSWCHGVLADGPQWSRRPALAIIGRCDEFVSDLKENISWISVHHRMAWDASCSEVREILFVGHEQIKFKGGRLLPALCELCLDLGRRAPPGWHRRLSRMDRRYREMFR